MKYFIQIQAVNFKGASEKSEIFEVSLAREPDAPTAATLTFERPEAGSGITYCVPKWQAPSFDGGAPIDSYDVMIGANKIECSVVSQTSCKFDQSLLLNAPYNIQWSRPFTVTIQAVNVVGPSSSSSPATWTYNNK